MKREKDSFFHALAEAARRRGEEAGVAVDVGRVVEHAPCPVMIVR